MSVVNSPGRQQGEEMLGDVGIGALEWRGNKATNILITIHDLCMVDTGTTPQSWKTAPATANQVGPWAVCSQTVTVAENSGVVSLKTHGVFYLKGSGVIKPWQYVENSATVAGRVEAFVTGTLDQGRKVGICLGKADTWDTGAPVNSADGDWVAVWIPFGGL
jgi:hypothetical protein